MSSSFSLVLKAEDLEIKPKALSTLPAQEYSEVQTEKMPLPEKLPVATEVLDSEPLLTEENRIPVLTSAKKIEPTTSDSIYKILLMILGVCLSGIGAYIYLKKVSKRVDTKSNLMQIKLLTQYHLGPKRSIAVVRVAGESILIGVTDHNISVLKTLSLLDEELPEVTPKDFNKTLNQSSSVSELASVEDDFEFAGIKDMVTSKIKNYRKI
jgi:flagellar protein FliO/FliZ